MRAGGELPPDGIGHALAGTRHRAITDTPLLSTTPMRWFVFPSLPIVVHAVRALGIEDGGTHS